MPIILPPLFLAAFLAIVAIRMRRRGKWKTSIFFSLVAWAVLGFLLFVLVA
jgi:hypothetical protein